jgi:acyl carrier protein
MSSEELTQRVLKAIATSKRIPLEQVTIDSDFQQLNIDSMDAVEILFALENEFDINIPDDDVREVRNVRQMVDGVAKLVAAKAAPKVADVTSAPATPADAPAGQ